MKGEFLSQGWVFDEEHYGGLNAAREPLVRRLLIELKPVLAAARPTAIDVGCGLGYYSNILASLGFDVVGVDARKNNVEESRRRYPKLSFEVADAEDPALSALGTFDVVFCFGLLYHLENPFRAVRNLSAMTSKLSIIEGICYPSPEPVLVLMDEIEANDQGVNAVAYYPSESALGKMFLRSGFAELYLPNKMPEHAEYQPDEFRFRRRTVLIASKVALKTASLTPYPQPPIIRPWDSMAPLCSIRGKSGKVFTFLERLRGWLRPKLEDNNRQA